MLSRVASIFVLLAWTLTCAAEEGIKAIVSIKAKPNASVHKNEAWSKPIVIKTAEDATKYFDADALEALKKEADFQKQFLLVFAWKGSGGDKLNYAIAESFPEQIFFSLVPGKTDDLCGHVHVFALRSNVSWSTKKE